MKDKQYATPHGIAVVQATTAPGVKRVYGTDGEVIGHLMRLDAGYYEARATRSQLVEVFEGSMLGEGVAWLTERHEIWTAGQG